MEYRELMNRAGKTRTPGDRLYRVMLPVMLLAFLGLGMYMRSVPPALKTIARQARAIKTRLVLEQPKVKKPEPAKKKKPVDISNKPKLAQKNDDLPKKTVIRKKAPRRVYGLRKVYSRGIGSGGTMADAVIGKLGNTINKDVDTLKATKEDIKGQVVSVTTITSAPKFKTKVKPEYTSEMLKEKIEGIIKVKVMVDIDGKVKRAMALNDLGHGSADQAMQACRKMTFEPAKRDTEPVAVWIVIPIRFVMLS